MEPNSALEQSKKALEQVSSSVLNGDAIISLIVALGIAMIAGRLLAEVIRRITRKLSDAADKAQDLKRVNFLRRIETLLVLTTALMRMLLVVIALYVWWVVRHPGQQPTALVGATALTVIFLGGLLSPILRDLSYGGVMMAERWYGVGDYVKIEPFDQMTGVVERVTLRSTRIRGVNGEIIWVNNQNIAAVRITPKGVRTLAIDLFVTDLKRGLTLIAETNRRLPAGPLMLVRPLRVTEQTEVEDGLWHLTAVGDTAPGREWLLEDFAPRILKELDDESKKQILENEPMARYADHDADARMIRTINNARKSPMERGYLPLSTLESRIGSTLKRTGDGVMRRGKSKPSPKTKATPTASVKKTTVAPAPHSPQPLRKKPRKIQ
jgi:hypothetical protein